SAFAAMTFEKRLNVLAPAMEKESDPILISRLAAPIFDAQLAADPKFTGSNELGELFGKKMIGHPDTAVQAFNFIGRVGPLRDDLLNDPNIDKAINKLDIRCVRELALSLTHLPAARAAELFPHFARKYDGSDHFYRAALNIACGTDPERRKAILADFDKHFPEWNDKIADLVWELRPASVLPRLGKLLEEPRLTPAQKGRIVDILAVNDDPAAGKTLLGLLKPDVAPEVKAKALDNLKLFLPGKWSALRQGKEIDDLIGRL